MIREFVIAGGVAEQALVPDRDDALLGYVVRGKQPPRPLYDTVALLPAAIAEDLDSSFSTLLEHASQLAADMGARYPEARFMLPAPERKVLDSLARAGCLILWDQLYGTLKGTVQVTPTDMATVYDFDGSVQVLRESMDGSDWDTDEQVIDDVVDFVDRMLVQAWIGDRTPYILFAPSKEIFTEPDPLARQDGEALQPTSSPDAQVSDPGTQSEQSPAAQADLPFEGIREHGGSDSGGAGEVAPERDPAGGDGSETLGGSLPQSQ